MLETFKDLIRDDIEEFVTTRKMHRAKELSERTGQHFNHNEYPLYFTGKIDADLVLVHLNPKQRNNSADAYAGTLSWPTFEAYFDYHQHFGRHKYGIESSRTHKSPFDHKQVRFLRPFAVLDLVEEKTREDVYLNLQRVIDDKLQLELIPYGSDTFSTRGFTREILQPYIDRVLDVISAYPRKYVLFCGRIFEVLLRNSILKTHEFKLMKNNGEPSQNKAKFSNLRLDFRGTVIHAGLAHTFAQQGIPMREYGRQCKELYHQNPAGQGETVSG